MATGFGSAGANTALDALVAAYPWIKMHTGSPGAAGTTNVATETTRKQLTWNASSGGSVTNSNTVTWTNVAGSETYADASFWTASSAGTFGMSGGVTANPVTAGDTFTIAAAAVTVSVTLAS